MFNRTLRHGPKYPIGFEGIPMAKKGSVVYVFEEDESVGRALVRLLRWAGLDAETFSSADDFLNNPKQKKK